MRTESIFGKLFVCLFLSFFLAQVCQIIKHTHHLLLIVFSHSDPVCWDSSIETWPQEAALLGGKKLWLHLWDHPGIHSRGDRTALRRMIHKHCEINCHVIIREEAVY